MAVGKKVSPAKFLGTAALGMGILQGASSYFASRNERNRLKQENQRAKKAYQENVRDIKGIQITNPYADIQTQFENPFEDLTVNQQQAQFQADQAAQSRANVLSGLRGAAGGSGVAGLAQALANQATTDIARSSASIGQQEARNQRLAAQGAAQVQGREFDAQQVVASGELERQERESDRQLGLIELRSARQQAAADYRAQRAQATQNMRQSMFDIIGGVGMGVAGGFMNKDGEKTGFSFSNLEESLSKPLGRSLLGLSNNEN